MKTSCKHCRANIVQRVYLSVEGMGEPLPLFAETYACGAVQLWGLTEGDGAARSCPSLGPRSQHNWHIASGAVFVRYDQRWPCILAENPHEGQVRVHLVTQAIGAREVYVTVDVAELHKRSELRDLPIGTDWPGNVQEAP